MQATSGSSVTWVLPAIISVAVVGAVALGAKLPLIGNGRAAFFVLVFFGSQLCGLAFRVPPSHWSHGWLNPFTVAGAVIGLGNMLLVASVLFRFKLPLISSVQAATLALGASMLVKVILAALRSAIG